MTVKKKVTTESKGHGRIDVSSHLKRVREAISQLPSEESEMETNQATESTAPKSGPKKIVKKTPAKAAPKKAPAKAAPAANTTTLAEVCKSIKGMKPRRARRILRDAKVKNPGRWTWAKGSADQKKVEKLLKDADAE
jgi:hypothetical protein